VKEFALTALKQGVRITATKDALSHMQAKEVLETGFPSTLKGLGSSLEGQLLAMFY
jgi:hypothetical protein